jgi:hypothetical protein
MSRLYDRLNADGYRLATAADFHVVAPAGRSLAVRPPLIGS